MKHNYSLIVGNIGETLQTSNGFDALREYRRAIADSKAAYGRASGETVTLMRDGEPWREYVPPVAQFYAEITDTFGGEANYGWVDRFLIHAPSWRGAVRKLTQETGYSLRMAYNTGDMRRYNVSRACICAFVQWADADTADQYPDARVL